MPPDDRDPTWSVLIEELQGTGQSLRPVISKQVLADSYDHACQIAKDVCLEHRPKNPWSPQSRAVFQAGDDSWIVLVHGAASTFHFRVIVVRSFDDTPH